MSLVEGKGADPGKAASEAGGRRGWSDAEGEEAFPGGESTGLAHSSGHRRSIFLGSCHLVKVSMVQNP